MDSFEFNKIAGAVLGTALGVVALSLIADIIYEPGELTGPSYVIAVADTGESALASSEAAEPISVRLADADISAGERSAKKCLACHTFEPGGPAKVGPNLYGIVGGPAAHMDGFKYSDAMLQAHEEGWVWGFDNLDEFLTAPKSEIPGTAMAFAGLKRPDERADVIAYLNSLAAEPLPYPPPPPPPGDTAAADDSAAATDATTSDAGSTDGAADAAPSETDTDSMSTESDGSSPDTTATDAGDGSMATDPTTDETTQDSATTSPPADAGTEGAETDATAPESEASPDTSEDAPASDTAN